MMEDFESELYEQDPPEWLERSDDYNVFEEAQIDRDRDAGEYEQDIETPPSPLSPNTVEQRAISHELAEAWRVHQSHSDAWDIEDARMDAAIDAIIAAYTPGYNADSPPAYPEEYVPGTSTLTEAAVQGSRVLGYDTIDPRDGGRNDR